MRIPSEILNQLYKRSGGTCEICRRAYAQGPHHILPVSQGGQDTLTNLLHSCNACHAKTHPWLNNKGIKRTMEVYKKDIIGTYYRRRKDVPRDITILAQYSQMGFGADYKEIAEKVS